MIPRVQMKNQVLKLQIPSKCPINEQVSYIANFKDVRNILVQNASTMATTPIDVSAVIRSQPDTGFVLLYDSHPHLFLQSTKRNRWIWQQWHLQTSEPVMYDLPNPKQSSTSLVYLQQYSLQNNPRLPKHNRTMLDGTRDWLPQLSITDAAF